MWKKTLPAAVVLAMSASLTAGASGSFAIPTKPTDHSSQGAAPSDRSSQGVAPSDRSSQGIAPSDQSSQGFASDRSSQGAAPSDHSSQGFASDQSSQGIAPSDRSSQGAAPETAEIGATADGPAAKRFDSSYANNQKLADFWTPERMKQATPLDPTAAKGLAGGTELSSTAPASTTRFKVPRWAGKLFFTISGKPYVCSAATAATKRRNVVLTAGHCVKEAGGAWHGNFVFVPKYKNGRAPLGRWKAVSAVTYRSWARNGNYSRDMAMLKMGKRNGRKIQGVTGGKPILQGLGRKQSKVRIIGWPAEAPFSGEVARRCMGSTYAIGSYSDAVMRCDMNGGASGGPWVKGTRGIFAVSSRRTTSGTKRLLATPFPRGFKRLMNSL